jgi:hypothetical protein
VQKFGWDGMLSRPIRFAGRAVFTPQDGCLHFRESGVIGFGDYRGDATQAYQFRPHGPAADVFFEDGRLFHKVDLATGRAAVRHLCPPDLYEGRYRVLTPDTWTVTWRITGPRKRQVIGSRFTRSSYSL